MQLSELRDAIENGKTAKLFVPKTHEYGIDLTIRVVKQESQLIWQRATIEETVPGLNLSARTISFETWEEFIEKFRESMQLRDSTWVECEEAIEQIEESQLAQEVR
jgi:hypothetical protein